MLAKLNPFFLTLSNLSINSQKFQFSLVSMHSFDSYVQNLTYTQCIIDTKDTIFATNILQPGWQNILKIDYNTKKTKIITNDITKYLHCVPQFKY